MLLIKRNHTYTDVYRKLTFVMYQYFNLWKCFLIICIIYYILYVISKLLFVNPIKFCLFFYIKYENEQMKLKHDL